MSAGGADNETGAQQKGSMVSPACSGDSHSCLQSYAESRQRLVVAVYPHAHSAALWSCRLAGFAEALEPLVGPHRYSALTVDGLLVDPSVHVKCACSQAVSPFMIGHNVSFSCAADGPQNKHCIMGHQP